MSTGRGPVSWSRTEVVEMLAWLDLCLESRRDFPSTIVGHLRDARKEATGEEFLFTQLQVKNKLIALGRRNSGDHPLNFKTVRERGSKCLQSLPPGMQEEIKRTLERYRLGNIHSRRLRADGFTHHNSSGHPRIPAPSSGADESGDNHQTRDAINNSTDEYGLYPHESSDGLRNRQIHPHQELLPTPRGPRQANHYRGFQSTPDSIVLRPRTPDRPRRYIRESSPSRVPASDFETHRVMARNPIESHIPLASKAYDPAIKGLERLYRELLSKKDSEIKRLEEGWQAEVEDLYARDAQMKEEIKTLHAKMNHLQLAGKDMLSNRGVLQAELFLKRQRLWAMTQLNLELQREAEFFKRIPTQEMARMPHALNEAMDDICADLESILHGHDFRIGLLTPRVSSASDLGALIRSSLQRPGEAREAEVLLKDYAKRFEFDPELIIRTFTLTALRNWVFETNYPNLIPTHSALLEAYRAIAFNFGDWSGLHNYDLAAYKIVLDEQSQFSKNMLPRTAKKFASRLSRALAPLFVEYPRQDADFESWGQEHPVCENRRFCLNGLFEKALKFKAQSVTTDAQYRFIVHPPGTPASETASDFWLHASIHTYKVDQSDLPDDDLANALVQPMNFLTQDIPERVDLHLCTKLITMRKKEEFVEFPNSIKRLVVNNNRNNSLSRARGTFIPDSSASETLSSLMDLDQVNTLSQSRPQHMTRQSTSNKSATNESEPLRVHRQSNPQNESSDSTFLDEDTRLSGTMAPDDGAEEDDLFRCQGGTRIDSAISPQRLRCGKCGIILATLSGLHRHVKKNSCKKCRDCGRTFARPSMLESHRKAEHSSNSKTAGRRGAASRNLQTPPSTTKLSIIKKGNSGGRIAPDRHICGTCDKPFTAAKSLKIHIRDKLCSKCFICGYLFHRKLDLVNHQKVSHINPQQEVHPTATAAHPTTTAVGINTSVDQETQPEKRHSLSAELGGSEYHCDSCNQDFSCLLGLEDHHQRRHYTGNTQKRRRLHQDQNRREDMTSQDQQDLPSPDDDNDGAGIQMAGDTANCEPLHSNNSIIVSEKSSKNGITAAPQIIASEASSEVRTTENASEDHLSRDQKLKATQLPSSLATTRQLERAEPRLPPNVDMPTEVENPPASGPRPQSSSTLSVVISAFAWKASQS